MYKVKKISFKKFLLKNLNESSEPFFYLAPDVIGSINNTNIDLNKKTFIIDFSTTNNEDLKLTVPTDCFNKWLKLSQHGDSLDMIKKFLIHFLEVSKHIEDDHQLEEIVDEEGNLIGQNTIPSNGNNSKVGSSKFGSDKVVKQALSKSRRYYGDLGLGMITW